MRCPKCGQPLGDHMSLSQYLTGRYWLAIPVRYWWRAWWRHKLLKLINPILSRIDDTHPDW